MTRIIHRDLKPTNLMLEHIGGRPFVKILDFGIAKVMDLELTQSGVAVGTPKYMSPEQIKGSMIDARSDLYCLGAIAFECLTGRPVFNGENYLEICQQHLTVPATRLASLQPHTRVPDEVSDFVAHLLEKDPPRQASEHRMGPPKM